MEKTDNPKESKTQILEAEHAFNQMAQNSGVAEAFIHFAAEDAVIKRGDELFKGKAAIISYFSSHAWDDIKLTWEPTFADVSSSGDLGYTYGTYNFSTSDTAGNPIKATGIFHTVWKRQADGSWKFVWD